MLTLQQRLAQAQMEKAGADLATVANAATLAEAHNEAVSRLREHGFDVIDEGRVVIVVSRQAADWRGRETCARRFDSAAAAVLELITNPAIRAKGERG